MKTIMANGQIFGSTASELEVNSSQQSKQFFVLQLHLANPLGMIP